MFYFCGHGEMAEWSNAAVLKTVVRSHGPGVRIPLSPQSIIQPRRKCGFFYGLDPSKACFCKETGHNKVQTAPAGWVIMVCRVAGMGSQIECNEICNPNQGGAGAIRAGWDHKEQSVESSRYSAKSVYSSDIRTGACLSSVRSSEGYDMWFYNFSCSRRASHPSSVF